MHARDPRASVPAELERSKFYWLAPGQLADSQTYRSVHVPSIARRPALVAGLVAGPAGPDPAALAATPPKPAGEAAGRAYAAVDPFIGTGGEGHTFPGAAVPFGMIQLSPDTQIKPRKDAYDWAAGYRYDDSTIVGFSHTHFSGTGHSDLGDVLVMPIAGEVKLERGDTDKPGSGYTLALPPRRRESRSPATTRSRWTTTTSAPNSPPARASACIATPSRRASRRTCCSTCARACTTTRARCCGRACALRADGTRHRFSRNARLGAGAAAVFRDALLAAAQRRTQFHDTEQDVAYKGFPPPGENDAARSARRSKAAQLVGAFDFGDAPGEQLVVKVVDLAGQRRQRHRQPRRRDGRLGFRSRARRCAAQLGAGARRDRRRCARADAHAASTPRSTTRCMGPSLFMDSDGRYRGPDNAVHQAEGLHATTRRSRCGTPTARCIRC